MSVIRSQRRVVTLSGECLVRFVKVQRIKLLGEMLIPGPLLSAV